MPEIEYIRFGYEFDPVQAVFHQSKYQDDPQLSGEFPQTIRIERNQKLLISSELVLTHLQGHKWLLITGLTPLAGRSGFYVGNKVQSAYEAKKKTSMVVIYSDPQRGKMWVYLFPEYDQRTVAGRCKAASDFIKSVCKNKARA